MKESLRLEAEEGLEVVTVTCKAVRRGIFRDRAKLYSDRRQGVVIDSFLGPREFYLPAGRPVVLKVPKGWMVQAGEERAFEGWITYGASSNAWGLPWRWVY